MPHTVRNPRKLLVNLPQNQNEIKLVSAPNAISTSAQFNFGRLARCELSLLLHANLIESTFSVNEFLTLSEAFTR
jgi:hypothetical protein